MSLELEKERGKKLWVLVMEQFKDKLVIILLISAIISFILAFFGSDKNNTDFMDPFVILTILVINAIISISQETNAEKAIAVYQPY